MNNYKNLNCYLFILIISLSVVSMELFASVVNHVEATSSNVPNLSNSKINKETTLVHIPAQPLNQALILFSIKYNRMIVANPELLKGRTSTEVKGQLSASDALIQLIHGTGLNVEVKNNQDFLIRLSEIKLKEAPSIVIEQGNSVIENEKISELEVIQIKGQFFPTKPSQSSTSKNVIEPELLVQYKVDDIALLSMQAPSLINAPSDGGISHLNIRGISNYTIGNQTLSSVPVHLDGLYLPPFESTNLIIYDTDSLTVFAGPQMTEKGHSSVGGSIYLESAPPVLNEDSVNVDITMGNYDLINVQSTVNIGMMDTFAVRFSSYYEKHDGYTHALNDYRNFIASTSAPLLNYPDLELLTDDSFYFSQNNQSQDDSDKYAFRLSGLWQLDPSTVAKFKIETQHNDSQPQVFIDPYLINNFERAVVVDSPIMSEGTQDIVTFDFGHYLSEFVINYTFNYAEFGFEEVEDYDSGLNGSFEELRQTRTKTKQISHGLELYSTHSDELINWLLGVHIEDSDYTSLVEYDLAFGQPSNPSFQGGYLFYTPDFETKFRELYGRLHYPLSADLNLVLGGRYSENDRRLRNGTNLFCDTTLEQLAQGNAYQYMQSAVSDDNQQDNCFVQHVPEHNKTWYYSGYEVSLQYQISNLLSSHLGYSVGERPGEFNAGSISESQHSKNIELGFKGHNLAESISYSMTAYHTQHIDILRWTDFRPFDADVSGAEFKLDANSILSERFHDQLSLTLSLIKSEITEYDTLEAKFNNEVYPNNPWNPPSSQSELAQQGLVDLSGNELVNAPNLSSLVRYHLFFYTDIGTFKPEISMQYVDSYYLDVFNRDSFTYFDHTGEEYWVEDVSKQDAYTKWDALLQWQLFNEKMHITAAIYNLTDEKIKTTIRDNFFSSHGFSSSYQAPRTYMVTLGFTF